MPTRAVIPVLALALLTACESRRFESIPASRVGGNSTAAHSLEPFFPISEIVRENNEREVVPLIADYGYLIDWPTNAEPRFYVFDKPRRVRTMTRSWGRFLALIDALPDRAAIDRIERCTAPFAPAMPDDKRAELNTKLTRKQLQIIDVDDARHVTIETCEARRIGIIYNQYRP